MINKLQNIIAIIYSHEERLFERQYKPQPADNIATLNAKTPY